MFTAEFFVALAFIIFMGIVLKAGAHKTILAAIDSRGARISQQLSEADRLRKEAAELLKTYEAKRIEAEKDAAAIVAAAKDEAKRLEVEASAKLADFVKRRTAQAEAKIAQAEAQATAEVRAAAADVATKAAASILAASKTDDAFAKGLEQVKSQLN